MKLENFEDAMFGVETQVLSWADTQQHISLYGLRRMDTGELMATCSDRYSITQNKDLVEASEAAFEKDGLTFSEKTAYAYGGGKRCFFTYDFSESTPLEEGSDETSRMRITIVNSCDKTLPRAFRVSVIRDKSGAIMTGSHDDVKLEARHTINSELNPDSVHTALTTAVNEYKIAQKFYADLSRSGLTQEKGHQFMKLLERDKIIGKRVGSQIGDIWDVEKDDRNVFTLLGACYQFLDSPHSKYKMEYFEQSERIKVALFSYVWKEFGPK